MVLLRVLKTVPVCKYLRSGFLSCYISKRPKHSETSYEDDEDDLKDGEYEELVRTFLPQKIDHGCFIVHPYVKWGPKKVTDTNPQYQLDEAVSLVRTLNNWSIRNRLSLPVESLQKKTIFGSGNLKKIKDIVSRDPLVTMVFMNVSTLTVSQKEELQKILCVPVVDRYNVVMLILKLHATSKHAKLQVALAELAYLYSRLRKENLPTDFETKRRMLQIREQKIKNAVAKLRQHRELLRTNRKRVEYPVIAVVGYTNSGKTSLIKALTKDDSLQPRDQLFATLDVTLHAGLLPSRLKVLYVDTVGFISNIPTNLIECFVATLEDALFADLILHVEDLANENLLHQRNHVLETLRNLGKKVGNVQLLDKIVTVGNKCDLVKIDDDTVFRVSAKTEFGIDRLREVLESAILESTARVKITIKVPSGGDEIRWLYKNATVSNVEANSEDCESQNVSVIISQGKLQQFKHHFIGNKC